MQLYSYIAINVSIHSQIIGALVDIHNTMTFEKNTITDVGGALLLESFGQLRVFPQTNILFDRNSGRFIK